jgi:NAD(P)-dependent dehydrogenase (short-subunit alcohol dehydrogenase family)
MWDVGKCIGYEMIPLTVFYLATALDNAVHGIRVNAICPSWVETPIVDAAIAGNPELQKVMNRVIPIGRIAKTEEISDVIMFMSSPRASYVTGVGWRVDGGATLQMHTG